MRCRECGYKTDGLNESQPVCPACGSNPYGTSLDDLDFDEFEDEPMEVLTIQ
jgi:hypothetical protein